MDWRGLTGDLLDLREGAVHSGNDEHSRWSPLGRHVNCDRTEQHGASPYTPAFAGDPSCRPGPIVGHRITGRSGLPTVRCLLVSTDRCL